jgi:hypothetical protein
MKQLVTILLLLGTLFSLNAQKGVYLTYDDYVNGIVEAPEFSNSVSMRLRKSNLSFLHADGEKKIYDLKEELIWGYQFGHQLYRIDEENEPWLVAAFGDLIIYLDRSSVKYPEGSGKAYKVVPNTPMLVSIGLNGEMEELTKEYLLNIFGDNPEITAALQDVKRKPIALFEFLINGQSSNKR